MDEKSILTINVVTPDGSVYENTTDLVICKTTVGEIGIMPNHLPLLASLAIDEVRVKVDDENFDVSEGKNIEKYELFEQGTNVNFVKVVDDENIIVKTWERGAGATYSCGTGCSASVVVSNKLNLTKKKVNVKVPGGDLRIEIEDNSIYMIGDASFICDGRAY